MCPWDIQLVFLEMVINTGTVALHQRTLRNEHNRVISLGMALSSAAVWRRRKWPLLFFAVPPRRAM